MTVRVLFPSLLFAPLTCGAALAGAAPTDMAKGTMTLQGESEPFAIVLTHAYFVTGPDRFDAKKTTTRLIFTGEDVRAKIDACNDADCATYAASDGLRIDLDPEGPTTYWAHVKPMQYSGMIDPSSLKLSTQTPDRLAGTLTYKNSGVDVKATFDATLVKTFPAAAK